MTVRERALALLFHKKEEKIHQKGGLLALEEWSKIRYSYYQNSSAWRLKSVKTWSNCQLICLLTLITVHYHFCIAIVHGNFWSWDVTQCWNNHTYQIQLIATNTFKLNTCISFTGKIPNNMKAMLKMLSAYIIYRSLVTVNALKHGKTRYFVH